MTLAWGSRGLASCIVALIVAACGTTFASLPPVIPQQTASVRDGPFSLLLSSDAVGVTGRPIAVTAIVNYEGPDGVAAFSPSSGPVQFSISEVGGTIRLDGGGPADCVSRPIARGQLSRTGFIKAGGYDPNDPEASFYRAFMAEPQLILPAGEWEIGATLNISLVGCAEATQTAATKVRVIVGP